MVGVEVPLQVPDAAEYVRLIVESTVVFVTVVSCRPESVMVKFLSPLRAVDTPQVPSPEPPPLPSGREGIHRYNLRPGFDGFVHDIKGRTIYVRFRYRRWY